MNTILAQYFSDPQEVTIMPITQGLINSTFEIFKGSESYILQKINTSIFKQPEVLVSNTITIGRHLKNKEYKSGIIEILPNLSGNYLTYFDGETWRLTNYIKNSVCYDKVISEKQAYAAAVALSEFHSLLYDIPISSIQSSIDGFLDYKKRVDDYHKALESCDNEKMLVAEDSITYINENLFLINQYLSIQFPQRIVHADAKISNFLFSTENENLVTAVIDWDTILPGNILCDFGDMVRTYSNLKAEDDPDPHQNFSAINYNALKQGFLHHLKDTLSTQEKEAMDLTAMVVILIQAIRFITDYLNGNTYYHVNYENHNLDRTINQLNLLRSLKKELCIN